MTPEQTREHYVAMKDELETRIDAIATIFAALTHPQAPSMLGDITLDELVTEALCDLGIDRIEITLAREQAGA